MGFEVYRGSENDVLDRFYQSVKNYFPEWVVRVTSDCPLIDPKLVDKVIEFSINGNVDYCSNNLVEHFPDGQDVEVIKFSALKNAWKHAKLNSEREHVTPYLRNSNVFTQASISYTQDLSSLRWTVDEPRDLDVIKTVFEHFHPKVDFSWLEVLELQKQQPEIFERNKNIIRNEGAKMGSGQ